jgi:hypothetical protein
MKTCNHCGEIKPDYEFSWRYKYLGIRAPTCKQCKAKFDSNYYQKRSAKHYQKVNENRSVRRNEAREFVWEYLRNHPCVDCGGSDPLLLEFDHVRGEKRKTVSEMVGQGYKIASIQKEIDKCEVRCVSCHRRKTYQERGWFSG